MSDAWRTVFNGIVSSREVTCQIYSEGGYRVLTTQAEDDPGSIQYDDDQSTRVHRQTMIVPPTAAGSAIAPEGETLEELRKDLIANGFSDAAAEEIVKKYNG